MKKNGIALLLLLLLIALAYWVYQSQNDKLQEDVDFKDFAIEDTASVDQIFMSDMAGRKVLISRREDGKWRVEGKYRAREDAIFLILKTAHDIQIQAPVPKTQYTSVISRLAGMATKVEFYTGGEKPAKVWYVGHPTASKVGTYMLLEKDGEKSDKPYVTHLMMERGSLGSRFFLDPILWRDRAMLRLQPENIKRIRVKHAYDTATSFQIDQIASAQFEITNLESGEVRPLVQSLAIPYFNSFKGVYYEYIDTKSPRIITDSIYASIPRHDIEVLDFSGKTYRLKSYNMPVRKRAEMNGKLLEFNPERMYALSSELGEDLRPIVQNLTFNLLVPRYEDFASSTTVEK